MVKNHLKRLVAPKTWHVKRKTTKFITRPSPGAHSLMMGLSINTLLKEFLGLSNTTKQTKHLLNNGEVLVDKKRIDDYRFIVGFMDIISIPKINKHFRLSINKMGRLSINEADEKESGFKLCKISNKKILGKEKVQINFSDGRNIVIKKNDYKVGDSLIVTLPKQTVKDHLPLDKKSIILLTGGKHIGVTGTIEDISKDIIIFKTKKGESFETSKEFAFVIGKDKPAIKIDMD